MKACLAPMLYFYTLVGIGNANAAELCPGIKQIVADSRNQFINFRGTFDFEQKKYVGLIVLGPFTACNTYSIGRQAHYKCNLIMDNWTDQDLKDNYLQIALQLKSCFGSEVSQDLMDDGAFYSIKSGVADFNLIPGHASSGERYLILDISTII